MTASFTRINAHDAQALIEQGESQIIDIRDAMSFQMAHISAALHIDNQSIDPFMQQAKRENPLIICCYHGNSSQNAAHYFSEQGFEKVYSLDGGFEQWKMVFPEHCES